MLLLIWNKGTNEHNVTMISQKLQNYYNVTMIELKQSNKLRGHDWISSRKLILNLCLQYLFIFPCWSYVLMSAELWESIKTIKLLCIQ